MQNFKRIGQVNRQMSALWVEFMAASYPQGDQSYKCWSFPELLLI